MRENIDFVIITALDIERNAILTYLPNPERIVNKSRIYYKSKIYNGTNNYIEIVLLSLPYMGNVNASIATSQAIEVWNPRYIILTGITGGIKKEGVHLGDLIVGEQILYYELGKQTDTEIIPRYQVQHSSSELLNYAHDFQFEKYFDEIKEKKPSGVESFPTVHFGTIASGEKVITNEAFGNDLKKIFPKALGVEMEGYGAALAAFQSENRPGFLFVKSICDFADINKNDEYQLYASHIAALYTISLLKSTISTSFDLKRNRKQVQRIEKKILNGKVKICICKDLLDDYYDLADYFDIPINHRKRFLQGRECQGIWEWLEARGKLEGILDALKYIDREDLIRCTE